MTPDPRHPVWLALADLFLDTDVRLSYAYIVRELARSPFSLDELKRMLDDEVTPPLQHNLMQVAGEWAGFPDEWVIEQVSKRVGKRRWLPNAIDLKEDWAVLSALVANARDGRDQERYLAALYSLIPLLTSSMSRTPAPPEYTIGELRHIFEQELKPLMLEGCRKLAKDSPHSYPSDAGIEENWRVFAGL